MDGFYKLSELKEFAEENRKFWYEETHVRNYELIMVKEQHKAVYQLMSEGKVNLHCDYFFNLVLKTYHEIDVLTTIGLCNRGFEGDFWHEAEAIYGRRFTEKFKYYYEKEDK